MLNYLNTLVVDQLRSLSDQKRIIVIHPNYADQHAVLAEFLSDEGAYVRFHGFDLDRAHARAHLDATLQKQNGAVAPDGIGVLILDECDRLSAAELGGFLEDLCKDFAAARLIVLTRRLPFNLVKSPDMRDSVAFIPSDRVAMLWDYTQSIAQEDEETETTDLLEVHAFGEGRVHLNGRLIDNWDGLLPRSLFFYLVDRGMTTRNDIFKTFWPNLPVREATNVFHVTKRKISEVLGIDLTTYWSGFYRISPQINLRYDVVQFNETINESAILSDEEGMDLLERGLYLYRGHFLSAMEMDWVKARRSELSQSYGEGLAMLAKFKADKGELREALGLYLRAAAITRHREDLTVSIMDLYRRLDMLEDAIHVYHRLVEDLQDDLGVKPAPHIQQLAADIRRDMNNR